MVFLFFQLFGVLALVAIVYFLIFRERKKNRYSPFTEPSLRSPGYSLSKQLEDLHDELFVPFALVALVPVVSYFAVKDLETGIAKILVIVVFAGMFVLAIKKIMSLWKKTRNIRLGLDGEVYTGQELNYLMRKGAWVYHDIPYKYGNIDHVVVSQGGVFVIETKSCRKPQSKLGGRDAKVTVKNDCLKFPHYSTSSPITQAKRHASYLEKELKDKLKEDIPVFPVIALPGWYVDLQDEGKKHGYFVMNPKRGAALMKFVQQNRIVLGVQEKVVAHIEKYARSVLSNTDSSDPDANKKFNLLLDRKPEEKKL